MTKITESLWRDDLTEEQIQEAERKLQKWLEESEDKDEKSNRRFQQSL